MDQIYESRSSLYTAIVEQNIEQFCRAVKQGQSGKRSFLVLCDDGRCAYRISCSRKKHKNSDKNALPEYYWSINHKRCIPDHSPNCSSIATMTTNMAVQVAAVQNYAMANKRIGTLNSLIGTIASEMHLVCTPDMLRAAIKQIRESNVVSSSILTGIQSYMTKFTEYNRGCNEVYVSPADITFRGCFTMPEVMCDIAMHICKRYLSIDAAHTYGEGQTCGKIYVLEAMTCLNKIIPIAISFDGNESNETWTRFLNQCVNGGPPSMRMYLNNPLTVIAGDRNNGIIYATAEALPQAARRADMHHIVSTNLQKPPYNIRPRHRVYKCADAPTKEQHDMEFEKLHNENRPAAEYLRDNVGVMHCAKYTFLQRNLKLYGQHSGTQNVESENHRLKARGIRAQRPLPALVELHTLQRELIQEHVTEANRLRAMDVMPLVVQPVQDRLDFYRSNYGQFQCNMTDQHVDNFVVRKLNTPSSMRTVNWTQKTCTCLYWQDTGIICIHGYSLAVMKGFIRANYDDFIYHAIDRCYWTSTFCDVFRERMTLQIPDLDLLVEDVLATPVLATTTRRVKRLKPGSEGGNKRRSRGCWPPRKEAAPESSDLNALADDINEWQSIEEHDPYPM